MKTSFHLICPFCFIYFIWCFVEFFSIYCWWLEIFICWVFFIKTYSFSLTKICTWSFHKFSILLSSLDCSPSLVLTFPCSVTGSPSFKFTYEIIKKKTHTLHKNKILFFYYTVATRSLTIFSRFFISFSRFLIVRIFESIFIL